LLFCFVPFNYLSTQWVHPIFCIWTFYFIQFFVLEPFTSSNFLYLNLLLHPFFCTWTFYFIQIFIYFSICLFLYHPFLS
jgi:hypothetical protein